MAAGQPQQPSQEFNEDQQQQQQQQQNNVIIHERQDSREQMLQLFDVLNKNQNQNLTIPMKMRNLPESFFRPPQIGSKSPGVHSRENSLDNGPFSPGPPVGSPGPPPGHHTRTSSCPATLGPIDGRSGPQHQALTAAANHHRQQHSFDLGGNTEDILGPLPPGWEKSVTPQGQVYFLNHNNKSTQWEDPRKTLYNNKIRQMSSNNGTVSPRNAVSPVPGLTPGQPQPQVAPSPPAQQLTLGPLPDGWEMKYTEQGEPYYIDHVNKRTQWHHPRKIENQGRHFQNLQNLTMQKRILEQKRMQLISRHQRQNSGETQMSQAQEMMMRHSLNEGAPAHTNIDPFLAGETHHNKQESADSGLGMGSNFNLGSIPEDMGLENMDTADLDTTLTEGNQGGAGGMETDQLIQGLPELGETLSQDIMQNILGSKEQPQGPPPQPSQDNLWL